MNTALTPAGLITPTAPALLSRFLPTHPVNPATAADLAQLEHIRNTAFANYPYQGLYSSKYVEASQEGNIQAIVARSGDKIVGHAALVRDPLSMILEYAGVQRQVFEVGRVMVDPSQQGRGLGTKLVEAATLMAEVQGANFAFAEDATGHLGSIRAFEKKGYNPVGMIPARWTRDIYGIGQNESAWVVSRSFDESVKENRVAVVPKIACELAEKIFALQGAEREVVEAPASLTVGRHNTLFSPKTGPEGDSAEIFVAEVGADFGRVLERVFKRGPVDAQTPMQSVQVTVPLNANGAAAAFDLMRLGFFPALVWPGFGRTADGESFDAVTWTWYPSEVKINPEKIQTGSAGEIKDIVFRAREKALRIQTAGEQTKGVI